MTPEKKVKVKVVAILKEFGAYYFYPVSGGYGTSGVPDIVGCFRGKFFAIECKAGKGTTTALQERNIAQIIAQGGLAIVVNEDNIEEVRSLMYSMGRVEEPALLIGDYATWPVDDAGKIGITYIPTGEIGIFNKTDLEPYIKGFFGLNF
jgi:hypothetical protein